MLLTIALSYLAVEKGLDNKALCFYFVFNTNSKALKMAVIKGWVH